MNRVYTLLCGTAASTEAFERVCGFVGFFYMWQGRHTLLLPDDYGVAQWALGAAQHWDAAYLVVGTTRRSRIGAPLNHYERVVGDLRQRDAYLAQMTRRAVCVGDVPSLWEQIEAAGKETRIWQAMRVH